MLRQHQAGLTDTQLLADYVEGRDGAAFEALIHRHGPMVWGVCRRLLPGHQDAEDVFQAVFLVLARKAAAVEPREMLPNWLHGVAHSAALQARRAHARRLAHERRFASRSPSTTSDPAADDLRPLLDRELSRLPDRYRVAVVLCDLEGKTRQEAARQLGWPEGTVAGRLARARAMLAARLTRRGVALAGAPLATLLSREATAAGMPVGALAPLLTAITTRATGPATGPVALLTHGVLRAMFLTKLKTAFAAVALTAFAAAGVGVGLPTITVAGPGPGDPPAKSPPPAKPAPAAVGVSGKVVRDSDGAAVPNADVRLLSNETSEVPRPTTKARANERGEFRFAGVKPGDYVLIAYAGELTSRTEMMRGLRVKVPAAEPVTLRMKPGVSLKVRVLSEASGQPLPGANVGFTWTDLDTDLVTDAKGEITFPALTKESWQVEASAKGHAKVTQALNLASGEPASIELKLPPGAAVAGVVRDAAGQPLAQVGISVFREDSVGGQLAYVKTDAQGRYRFGSLPVEQSLQLSVRKLEYLSETKPLRLATGQAEATNFDLVLKPRPHGGSARGVVTDAAGKPVAGAVLTNVRASDEVRTATTDAGGKYLLDNVYGGVAGHEFVVRAEGHAPQLVTFKPGPAAAPAVVDVKLEAAHTFRGRVVDPAGKPLAGVYVTFAEGKHMGGIGGEAETDAQGRVRFTSLPAKSPFTLQKEGYSEISNRTLPLDGADEVTVTLSPQGVILGKVVDAATGKPLPRFTVQITFSPERKDGDLVTSIRSARSEPGEAFDSAKGEFRLDDLVAGMPLQVTVSAEGYRKRVVRRAVAAAGAEAKATEFRLTAEDPAKLVTYGGKLVSAGGAGVEGVNLRLVVAGGRPKGRTEYPFNWQMVELGQLAQVDGVLQFRSGTTAAGGAFEFRGVPPDAEVELVYWGKGVPGARVDRLDRRPAAERAALVVKALASATVTGTIDRKAFPELDSIKLSGGATATFHAATLSADGTTFTVEDLPPGQYELQVYGPYSRLPDRPGALTQQLLARKPVPLKEGQSKQIDVTAADKAKQ